MTVKVLKRDLIRHGRVFAITMEQVRFPNGCTIEMDIIRHPGASAIVAIDEMDRVILLEQYRHAIGCNLVEIPAGTFESKETPLACAQRELLEETGFTAESWEMIGVTTPVAGYADEKIHLFMAMGLVEKKQDLDPDEIAVVKKVPLQDTIRMVSDGRIHDAKTVAALFLVLSRRGAIQSH